MTGKLCKKVKFKIQEPLKRLLSLKLQQQKCSHVWCAKPTYTVRDNVQPTAVLNVGIHSLQGGQRLVIWTLWLTVYFLPLTLQDLD